MVEVRGGEGVLGMGPIIQHCQEIVMAAGHNLDIVPFLYFCRWDA